MNAKIPMSVTSEIEEIWKKYFVGAKKVTYKETLLVESFLSKIDSVENFEVYDDDIWLCGFPKSGTTWTQEMVWNIVNDLNFEAAKATVIFERFPFLEYTLLNEFEDKKLKGNISSSPWLSTYKENSVESIKNLPRPRFIKTHLPFRLLPRQLRTNEKKAKIVYMWRNAKDVCISYYHFSKWTKRYSGDYTDMCKLFLNDAVVYMPYWSHLIEFWERRNEENILILKYEDMKADLSSVIKKTAHFFGKNFDDEQISRLENHLSFSSMSTNKSVNFEGIPKWPFYGPNGRFMRKGEADQWKTAMSSEVIDQFDAWIRENLKNHESLLRELS